MGSVVGISGSDGVFREKLAYDAWGKRRTTAGLPATNTRDGTIDHRGFTGHEMLDKLDLAHMNGRIYDPFLGRFLSADPLIQDPEHSQSYNRYSYVWNNPTNLTDPTGFAAEKVEKLDEEQKKLKQAIRGTCSGSIDRFCVSRLTRLVEGLQGNGAVVGASVHSVPGSSLEAKKDATNNFASTRQGAKLGKDYDAQGNFLGQRAPHADNREFVIGKKHSY